MSGQNFAAVAQALPQDYSDILQILPRLPEGSARAATASLAGMADLSPAARAQRAWLARWQGREQPRLVHPRLSVFVANHGVARLLPDQPGATALMQELTDPDGTVGQAVAAADADLRLYEMNLAQPCADLTAGPAMTQRTCVQAVAYGMMAVEMGLDCLALAAAGDGQDVAAAVMLAVLLERPLSDVLAWIGLPQDLAEPLAPAAARLQGLAPMLVLEQCGGYAIAALTGALLASRMAQTPVVIADWGALAACAVLWRIDPLVPRHVALGGGLTKSAIMADLLRIEPRLESQSQPSAAVVAAIRTLQGVA